MRSFTVSSRYQIAETDGVKPEYIVKCMVQTCRDQKSVQECIDTCANRSHSYAILYGIFTVVVALLGFRAGFSFSAGATDLVFSAFLPAAEEYRTSYKGRIRTYTYRDSM